MKRTTTIMIIGLVAVLAIATEVPAKHESHSLLTFETMYGVDGPFIGEANAIRGVVGDELPREIMVCLSDAV